MDPGHHHHNQLHHQLSAVGSVGIDTGSSVAGDRFPQWSAQETRDFLIVRAELDPTFMETKRNKLLWEVISTRMKEKGYNRSAEQCKCKWKNLVTRYKACETMEAEGMRQQFPFYNELQAIFAARMQRMLWLEAEGGGGSASAGTSSRKKSTAQSFSSDEEDENDDSEGEKVNPKKKRKALKPVQNPTVGVGSGNAIMNGVREMMDEFMRQQIQMEMEWVKAYSVREEERQAREAEWRQAMEALEKERMMMERRWREREEQRQVREEARAEKRDALITALLNKLRREDHHV